MRPRELGFSLIEMTVAMGITLVVTASVFSLMDPAQGAFASEPEIADVQQRTRAAADILFQNIVMAGAGAYSGGGTGPLSGFFAPVLPFRQGAVGADSAGTFKTDTITLIYVPSTASQTTISSPMPGSSPELHVFAESQCPRGQALCGFTQGTTILVYDDTGRYGLYEITSVLGSVGSVRINWGDVLGYTPPVGAKVVQAKSATYYLKTDTVRQIYQLMFYDGSTNAGVPVVDNVVGLTFEYYGDPQPPAMRKPLSDPSGPWTTYGPPPRTASPPYPVGENCVFLDDGSPVPAPRLTALGAGTTTLVRLTEAQLTDGPWCPNDISATRWDADLLRIRKVGVTIRVQSAINWLRGPAGALFAHGGTSNGGNRWVPDQQIRFEVSPRNLNLSR